MRRAALESLTTAIDIAQIANNSLRHHPQVLRHSAGAPPQSHAHSTARGGE
jgi:hypothetical protein